MSNGNGTKLIVPPYVRLPLSYTVGRGMSTVANGERFLQMTEVHSLGTDARRKDDTQDALH